MSHPSTTLPDQIAEVSRMFPLSSCVLPVLQNHLPMIDDALKSNRSTFFFEHVGRIPVHHLCKSLLDGFSIRIISFFLWFLYGF